MTSSTQTQVGTAYNTEVVVVNLASLAPQPGAALSPTSRAHLMAAQLQLDSHDLFVTSRSVLGYRAGLAFLDVLGRPGPVLADAPIAIEA